MTTNEKCDFRALLASWALAAFLGSALALGAAALWSLGSRGGESFTVPRGLIEEARAELGKGDYLFLPNRMAMWVVNRTSGKIIYYQFYDNQVGTVERSRIAAIHQEIFPLSDTDFLLSDRNLTSYLWVVNRVTGDFQLWRANRDGTLSTDENAVPAGDHLQGEPSVPSSLRDDRGANMVPGRRSSIRESGPAPTPQPQPERRIDPRSFRKKAGE